MAAARVPWLVAALVAIASASAIGAVDPGKVTAPRMDFAPPRPGSYRLEKIQPILNATLLDASGKPTPLAVVTTSKITLLTFFYTYCADPLGCPFAYHALLDIRGQLLDAGIGQQVRFLSISLDPTHDTPEAIARYREAVLRHSELEWNVLTAPSVRDLLPVLNDFGQDVSVELDSTGRPTRTMHHMLKMFLIDRQGVVREIYTLAFLHPEVIVNDIRTLALEGSHPGVAAAK